MNTTCKKNGWNKILKGFVHPPPFFFLLISGIRDGLNKESRELWSKGIGGVISSGQEFSKRILFFKLSLESKEYCDHIVKNSMFM